MKKLLLLFAFILGTAANATHLQSGFINALQKGNTDTVEIYITLFTDPQGIPGSSAINLQVLNKVNSFYQTYTTFPASSVTTGVWQGSNVNIYYTKQYLPAGDYRILYSECCRPSLSNSVGGGGMVKGTVIGLDYKKTAPGTPANSAPYIVSYLPTSWVVNQTIQTILPVVDLDGDSLLIEMDDALTQHANNTFIPIAPFTQLTGYGPYSVSGTGLIKWRPSVVGLFATGYKISEYRNGQLIGVSRIQQHYSTGYYQVPAITTGNNIVINQDTTATISYDIFNGDSLQVSVGASNATGAQLVISGATVAQTSGFSWILRGLNTLGVFKGYLRLTGVNTVMDFPLTLVVTSTIGVEEFETPNQQYKVYDWYGNYLGDRLEGLKGLFVLRFEDRSFKKVFVH
jgi:hypothetical protein